MSIEHRKSQGSSSKGGLLCFPIAFQSLLLRAYSAFPQPRQDLLAGITAMSAGLLAILTDYVRAYALIQSTFPSSIMSY
jgi:hypothetical protein